MLSFKIRYELITGKNLIGFDSGSWEDIVEAIKAEMQEDDTIRAAYIIEVIDEGGKTWRM